MSKDDLKSKISKWLEQQGYPLEMRVASILQNCGFRVVQSEYYTDPESGDSREIDIVAISQREIHGVLFRISLLIECKRSTDKPWILFTSPSTGLAGPARVSQRAANSLGKNFLLEACREKAVQDLPMFAMPERPAYGVTQAFTSGKDVCYSAVTSASKAAYATVAELDEIKEQRKKAMRFFPRTRDICSIALPVVIVEGELFETYLDEGSSVIVNEVNRGTLVWRNQVVGRPHTIVDIISSSNIDEYAMKVYAEITELFELIDLDLSQSVTKSLESEKRPPIRVL